MDMSDTSSHPQRSDDAQKRSDAILKSYAIEQQAHDEMNDTNTPNQADQKTFPDASDSDSMQADTLDPSAAAGMHDRWNKTVQNISCKHADTATDEPNDMEQGARVKPESVTSDHSLLAAEDFLHSTKDINDNANDSDDELFVDQNSATGNEVRLGAR
jgi:hypothetical protein